MSDSEITELLPVGTPNARLCWKKKIFTPVRLLAFFIIMNLLTYYDRGLIASTLDYIEFDSKIAGPSTFPPRDNITHTPTPILSHLSDTKRGALGSAFMGGYMVFAPIFASLANQINPTILVAVGQTGWVLATFFCGISPNYVSLLFARILVGVGEASFVGLVPAIIDNAAPPGSLTIWLGLFYAALPVGQALGIGLGGIIAKDCNIHSPSYIPGWRVAFIAEAFCMVPLVVMCLFIPQEYSKPKESEDRLEEPGTPKHLFRIDEALKALFTNPSYVLTCLGYSSYTFVIGALAFWIPSYISSQLPISSTSGSAIFGAITVICGIFGTAAGGFIVDKKGGGPVLAMKFVTLCTFLAFPVGALCFVISQPYVFFLCIAISEFLLFNIQAPINTVLMNIVHVNLRNYGMSFCVFIIHLLGDFPSPILIGFIKDKISEHSSEDKALRISMLMAYLWLLAGVVMFVFSWIIIARRQRRSRGNSMLLSIPIKSDK